MELSLQSTTSLKKLWTESRKKQLRLGLILLLALWALYTLAQLVWLLLLPANDSQAVAPSVFTATSAPKKAAVDRAELVGYQLFGEVGAANETVQVVQPVVTDEDLNAAKTKLDLQLLGVVYSSDQDLASAVISHRNKQDQYRVKDKLPGGNNVSLSKVLADRVIISNAGRAESLWLYEKNQTIGSSTTSAPRIQKAPAKPATLGSNRRDMRSDEEVTRIASETRQKLLSKPQSLAEVIRILPANQDGRLVGYRLSPGKDPFAFSALGLKPNDIVTSVNGIDLAQAENVLEVYQTLRSTTEASVSILRGESALELIISLDAGI